MPTLRACTYNSTKLARRSRTMAARKIRGTKANPWCDAVKDRIKTGLLLRRLHLYVDTDFEADGSMATHGGVRLQPTQATVALALINKTIPNMAPTLADGTQVANINITLSAADGRIVR